MKQFENVLNYRLKNFRNCSIYLIFPNAIEVKEKYYKKKNNALMQIQSVFFQNNYTKKAGML